MTDKSDREIAEAAKPSNSESTLDQRCKWEEFRNRFNPSKILSMLTEIERLERLENTLRGHMESLRKELSDKVCERDTFRSKNLELRVKNDRLRSECMEWRTCLDQADFEYLGIDVDSGEDFESHTPALMIELLDKQNEELKQLRAELEEKE